MVFSGVYRLVKQLLLPLRPLLFAVVVFSVFRLAYLFLYPEYFTSVQTSDLLQVFVLGWRFDMALTVMAGSVLFLFLLLPGDFRGRSLLLRLTLWLLFCVFCFLWLLNLGDLIYFGEVYRHAGREVLLLAQDYGMLFELALGSRWQWALLALMMAGLLMLGWSRLVVKPSLDCRFPDSLPLRLGVMVFALLLLVLAGRGGVVTGKPINLVDAYASGNEQHAALALNGAFSVVQNARRGLKRKDVPPLLSDAALQEFVQAQGWLSRDPFMTSFSGALGEVKDGKDKNLVVILLESWSGSYIDGLAGTSYGATPYFDTLLDQSRVWVNAYAAAQRSIEGIQAVLTSVPLIDNQPVIGWGLEQSRTTRLAGLLADRGYQTVMVQSSNRRSFHMDGIAAALGFEDYFGKEDLPLLRQYPGDTPRFGWDYEALMFVADYLQKHSASSDQPFFSFVFTGTTHEPFPDPGAAFHLHPHEAGSEGAYLNTLRYSDWALQQFMEQASQQDWYQDTIFVFVADHVLRASASDLSESFHIPLVIYTPDQSVLSPGREQRYASQYDVLPTVMTLLGIDEPVAAFGRSLLVDHPGWMPEGVLVHQGARKGWISSEGWFTFDAYGQSSASGNYAQTEALRMPKELLLRAGLEYAGQRIQRNQWFKPLALPVDGLSDRLGSVD